MVLLMVAGIGFANDYMFTITGELPISKLKPPANVYDFDGDFGYKAQKRTLNVRVAPDITTLSLNAPSNEGEIVYTQTKMIHLIKVVNETPQKLKTERSFFNLNDFRMLHKPVKLTIADQKTGGISVSLVERYPLKIPEIVYRSKTITYRLPPPPNHEPVQLSQERVFLQDGTKYEPIKSVHDNQSRISFGTIDLKQYRVGFSNPFVDTLISTDKSHLFFKNETLFIGAQVSLDDMTAIAYLPTFEFKTHLDDNTFVLRAVTEFDRLQSFDFGLALMNITPLPIINWYTTGSTDLFSIGLDTFSDSSYGLGIRLKNHPYLIRAGTGYNFGNEAFHAMIDGKYTVDRGLFNAAISYNDGFSLDLGAQYHLISNHPFSMSIYGNIDYMEDWLFSAGTKIRIGDIDLNARIKFITGGLSVDVEVGYSF